MTYELTAPPAVEPIELTEAKSHIRVDHTDKDADITRLIKLAREKVEYDCSRTLITSTWERCLDEFPRGPKPIRLTIPPVQQVTAITYFDTAGDEQTWDVANYWVDTKSKPARIMLRNGKAWPIVETGRPNAVTVEFVAGYGAAADVPEAAVHAIKLLIGDWWLHPEATLVGTISKELLFGYNSLIKQLQWTAHIQVDR